MSSVYPFMHRYLVPLLCFIGSHACLIAQVPTPLFQESYHHAKFTVRREGDTSFTLPKGFIVSGSETVLLDTAILLRERDYSLERGSGVLQIKRSRLSGILADTSSHTLDVRYRSFPFDFKKSYRHREPVEMTDTASGRKETVGRPVAAFSLDDLFGSNLQKSGSIVRGFTVGSNRDLTLNSGFRMQMSGKITDDIELIAALTDENSPIQPEGNTQTLREVDKVFIELRGNNLGATLGDFNLDVTGNEFGSFNRKLQGAKGNWRFTSGASGGNIMVAGAVTRGKFTTNQFLGLDGVQGPYKLSAENGNPAIIVIAGTERVYVNGEQLTRGENNDYTIDYSNAELTFTTRRLVYGGARITVDFEYNDRQFNRSLIGAKAAVSFMNDRWSLSATHVREGDDQNSPVDLILSEADIEILNKAGDDRSKAVKSGAEYTGTGKGQYMQSSIQVKTPSGKDSLLVVYKYAPEDTIDAVYSVSFSFVGDGLGSYKKISLGRYEFAGLYQGSYEPVRFLPIPEFHSLTDLDLGGKVGDDLKLTGEFAFSNFDPNRFSPLESGSHAGEAAKLGIQYSPEHVHLGNLDIGSLDLKFKERFVGKKFSSLERLNEVEFARKWNIQDSSAQDEELSEGSLSYRPLEPLSLTGGIGNVRRGEPFSSNRYTFATRLEAVQLPRVDYSLEEIESRNTLSDLAAGWLRQRGSAQYRLWIFTPSVKFANELLTNRGLATDTLSAGSYRFNEVYPGVVLGDPKDLYLAAETGWRWDDSLLAGSLERASRTFSQHYRGEFRDWNSLSSSLDLSIQKRTFKPAFIERKNSDAETILLRWNSQYNPLQRGLESEWFYEVATERSARLERVFQRVPKGTGSYVYLGDLNGNHTVDPADFQLSRFDGEFVAVTVPTDELVPVINLKASTRFRIAPEKIFSTPGGLGRLLSALSSETYLRVEEKSSQVDRSRIYLLHFSHFLNEETTISGSNLITQDLYVLENRPEFSLRFRYSQSNGLLQYALISERLYSREQSVRLKWQLVKEISNQMDYTIKRDILSSKEGGNRVRAVYSKTLNSDWSYRPEQSVELGFSIGLGDATNFDTTEASMNDQSVRLVFSFEGKGQLKAEMGREEVVLARGGTFPPFELTSGRIAGKTWLWNLSLEYRVTQFIQASVGYDGRKEADLAPVHTARAEVRAFF